MRDLREKKRWIEEDGEEGVIFSEDFARRDGGRSLESEDRTHVVILIFFLFLLFLSFMFFGLARLKN